MRIPQFSRTGADILLRVIGFLFWVMRLGGSLALFVQVVQWAADLTPFDTRQGAFNGASALVGWLGTRLCARWRERLQTIGTRTGFPAERTG